MYSYLVPKCAQHMALSVDKRKSTGGLILMTYEANDPSQMWETAYSISAMGTGLVLINKMSGLAAYAPNDRAPTEQVSIKELNASSIWTLGGTSPIDNAIRLLRNENMCLNAAGDGPWPDGNKVYVHDWNGASWNNLWTFKPA